MTEKKIAFSVLVVGLDRSGKSTMVRFLSGSRSEIYPTAGFEVTYLNCNGINAPVLVYDCSGVGRARDNWRTFYDVVEGVIFVIDSTDFNRVGIAKKLIKEMMADPLIKDKKPVIFAFNKQDEEEVIEKDELVEELQINLFKRTQKNPVSTKTITGITGEGVNECFLWIRDNKAVHTKTTSQKDH